VGRCVYLLSLGDDGCEAGCDGVRLEGLLDGGEDEVTELCDHLAQVLASLVVHCDVV